MAYDDMGAGPDPLASYADTGSGGNSFLDKIKAHSEVWIPLVLIIILFLFLSIYFGIIDAKSIPLVGGLLSSIMGEYKQILVIGEPWMDPYYNSSISILEQGDNAKKYKVTNDKTAQNYAYNAENRIKRYDLIIIDQTMHSDKSIPPSLAKSLEDYVFAGGKLILVGDSATMMTGKADLIGLPAVLNESMAPVDCMVTIDSGPKCQVPIPLNYATWNNSYTTKLFQGMDKVPPSPLTQGIQGLPFTVFNVGFIGDDWAYIRDEVTGKQYPGIVKKGYGVGKVIYFNYQEISLVPSAWEYVVEELIG